MIELTVVDGQCASSDESGARFAVDLESGTLPRVFGTISRLELRPTGISKLWSEVWELCPARIVGLLKSANFTTAGSQNRLNQM